MEQRFFENPYEDYNGQNVVVNVDFVRELIKNYVKLILVNTKDGRNVDPRGDLYVGDAGKTYFCFKYKLKIHNKNVTLVIRRNRLHVSSPLSIQ